MIEKNQQSELPPLDVERLVMWTVDGTHVVSLAQATKVRNQLLQALRERDEAIASHKITLDRETATTARYDTKLEKLEAELAAANHRADEAEAKLKEIYEDRPDRR